MRLTGIRDTARETKYTARGGVTQINLDKSTGKIWGTWFPSPNSWVMFDEPGVVSEFAKHPMSETEVKNLAFEMMTR